MGFAQNWIQKTASEVLYNSNTIFFSARKIPNSLEPEKESKERKNPQSANYLDCIWRKKWRRTRTRTRRTRTTTNLEGFGALGIEVFSASRAAASAIAASGNDSDLHVVAIHQAHVIEVVSIGAVEGELRQRGRRIASCTRTPEKTATIASLAAADSISIESAASATPEASSPSFFRHQRHRLSCCQCKSSFRQDRNSAIRLRPHPHIAATTIRKSESSRCSNSCRKERNPTTVDNANLPAKLNASASSSWKHFWWSSWSSSLSVCLSLCFCVSLCCKSSSKSFRDKGQEENCLYLEWSSGEWESPAQGTR